MRRNWTIAAVLLLLAVIGLVLLCGCPKKTVRPGGGEVLSKPAPTQPAEAPKALTPTEEAAPEEAAPEAAPEGEEAAPEAPEAAMPPSPLAPTPIDGFETLTFGMPKAKALASLPFGLKAEDAKQQPDFALDGDEAYLFKVPYSKYPLLTPKPEAKDENFGIAVGFWEGKFEYFTILISANHMDDAGWQKVNATLQRTYNIQPDVSMEGGQTGEVTITWMDAKGRAVSLVAPVTPKPESIYKIVYQSDIWLAQFAQ